MTISRWTDNPNVVYSCNEPLVSHMKEQNTDSANGWTSKMLNERIQMQKATYFMTHLYEISRKGKFIDTESKSVVALRL